MRATRRPPYPTHSTHHIRQPRTGSPVAPWWSTCDGRWYDEEVELRFHFSWCALSRFDADATRYQLETAAAASERKKQVEMEQVILSQASMTETGERNGRALAEITRKADQALSSLTKLNRAT